MRLSAAVLDFADTQRGLIRSDQLHACGLTDVAVHRMTAAGLLHPRHEGVFVVGRPEVSQTGEYLAAVFALGVEAVLGHHSAAAYARLVPAGGVVHVTVPVGGGRARRDGIRVHRQRLRTEEWTTVGGVPCTVLTRTLLDLADSAPRRLGEAFEEAQIQHRLRPAELAAALVARPGHRGTARVRTLLDGAVDPGQVQSILELRFLRLCAAYGLPRPQTQVRYGRFRVDFAFPDWGLVVETDGRRFHASAAKRRRDRAKDAYVEGRGEQVMHLRWADVVDTPEVIAARLHAVSRASRRAA